MGKLEDACIIGDPDLVKIVCETQPTALSEQRPAGTLLQPGYERNGLHVAAALGHARCCRVLLDAGADIDSQDTDGRTPLMLSKTFEVMDLLLRFGADVHARDHCQRTALHHCVTNVHMHSSFDLKPAIDALLSAGADVTAKDKFKLTPPTLWIEEVGYCNRACK